MTEGLSIEKKRQASAEIIAVLRERSAGMTEDDCIRYVYNEAIDDAANFLRDLVQPNPMFAAALIAVERAIRDFLPLEPMP